MPAIQPVRLKTQAAHLVNEFNFPERFVSELSALLDNYADHTHREGRSGQPAPLLASYNTPPQVLKQILLELKPLVSADPPTALTLCDALSAQPYLEHKLLAADLLGYLPLDFQDAVIERIHSWVRKEVDRLLIDSIIERSLVTIQQQSIQSVIDIAQIWVSNSELQEKQLGLRMLNYLAANADFDILPAVFRLLSPFLRKAPVKLRPDIIAVLDNLIQRTPPEAAYLLRQNLISTENPDTAWLIRQVVDKFPSDYQEELRKTLRQNAVVNP